MTPGRLAFLAVLIVLIYWVPQWMPRGTEEPPPPPSATLHRELQAGATNAEALQRALRAAERQRDSLSPDQLAMIEELRASRSDISKSRVVQKLLDTLEPQKRQTLSFYEWAAAAWLSAQSAYEQIQAQAQSGLWLFAIVMVALGITAALASRITLARWSARLGFGLSRGWLVILSLLAIALALVTRTNPWPSFPLELVLPPIVALVGCAIALRIVDLNYPVWNSLVRGCGAPLISMAFIAVFLKLV